MTRDDRASGQRAAILFAVVASSLASVGLAAWIFLRLDEPRPTVPEEQTRVEASSVALPTPEATESGELTLHRLPAGLDEATIYDVAVAPSGLWLGTGRGLVHRTPDGDWSVHRRFGAAPFEWVQALAVTDRGIVASVWVAPGSTSGTPMGTFLLSPEDGVWRPVGEASAISLGWDGDSVWGLLGTHLYRTHPDRPKLAWEEVDPGVRVCTEGRLAVAAGRVWIAQQGAVRIGRQSMRPVPCGVIAVDPATGDARVWEEDDGLASGFGRDVVGDDREVWAAHGVQGEGVSRFDVATGAWSGLRSSRNGVYLGANTLGLTPTALWLGTPDGRRPLKRLDRETGEARVVGGVPEDFFVSAVAGDETGAWVGLHRKHWEGESYRVESFLARVAEGGR